MGKQEKQVKAGSFSNTTDWISQKQPMRKHTVRQRELGKLKPSFSWMSRDI